MSRWSVTLLMAGVASVSLSGSRSACWHSNATTPLVEYSVDMRSAWID